MFAISWLLLKDVTPGPETKDSFSLIAIAIARISAFLHWFLYYNSYKQQGKGQIFAHRVVCITGEEHWVREPKFFLIIVNIRAL